ncbi:DedA family protein [Citricoccus sp. SGAir0253]|uniref:DedA family protein n=1 Tax=Citricoccus sp. SGAir0253 TaxID=2567881 RepID=UPI0010CD467B|nr:DedA family protein [Citricoccus sp. SGAir0253]QCU78686.1 DedA family protein [Citricoccus sp. SGAir0253]
MLQIIEDAVLRAAGQWWVLVLVYVLCTVDGFFPVVPSESVLVALASIAGAEDTVSLWWVWALGALGAITGDQVAYSLGRRIGVERYRWMRTRSVSRAVGSARRALDGHGALVIFTARYVPGGRVAVNYTAGATGYPRTAFTLLDVAAGVLWSAYSIGIARLTAGWLDSTLLQITVAVIAAAVLGWVLDVVLRAVIVRVTGPEEDTGPAGPGGAEDPGTPGPPAVDSPRD